MTNAMVGYLGAGKLTMVPSFRRVGVEEGVVEFKIEARIGMRSKRERFGGLRDLWCCKGKELK